MDLNWLEDFLALAEHRNFSRAAEARHVTQPAFSRRIRALEAWVGTPLLARLPQGVALNAAGESLREQAEGLTRDLHQMRRGALKAAGREGAALAIAATHALSFTFFPGLIRALPMQESLGTLNLISDTMAACERVLLAGDADFLLCHARSGVPTRLTPDAFTHVVVGSDQLVPVSVPNASGVAQWTLPGTPSVPVRLLTYSTVSGLGRILEATQREFAHPPALDPVFTAPLAAALHTMSRQGEGMAWLPRTMVAEDLAAGRLVEAGGDEFSIALEIRLVRPLRRQSKMAEYFWAAVSRLSAP